MRTQPTDIEPGNEGTATDDEDVIPVNRWAELLRNHECTAWIRHRIAEERAKAERGSEADDAPLLLKGWRRLP